MALSRKPIRALCMFVFLIGLLSTSAQAEIQTGGAGLTISDGNVVSLEFTLTLENKEVADTNVGKDPLIFTQGTHYILPVLETALAGMKAGDSKQVTVEPKDGYGEVDSRKIQEIPIDRIPSDFRKVGQQLISRGPKGREYPSVVKEVKEQVVVLDFNHILAGKTLFFDIKILDVKAGATP